MQQLIDSGKKHVRGEEIRDEKGSSYKEQLQHGFVGGKIHEKGEFWRSTLKASKFVMSVIENGYRLPFTSECPTFFAENNASSLRNYNFVTQTIEDLLRSKCIVETGEMPHCCNPLTVSETHKKRLVLDLRHVNKYLEQFNFRYENLNTVRNIFEKGFFFGCFDLKNGYFHISINSEYQQYLGFSWLYEDGERKYYVFVVVAFGLSPASYLFTKMVRPLVKKWRGNGIRCCVYLDDGIFGSSDKTLTSLQCRIIRDDLEAAGFTINEAKSTLYPVQVAVWLGFVINTIDFTFSIPKEKIERLQLKINESLLVRKTSARQIATIAGKIISMGPGIGALTRLFTRKMYQFIENSNNWDGKHDLDGGTVHELRFWRENLDSLNGYTIKDRHAVTKVVYTDASDHSHGGYIVQKLGNIIAHGSFSEEERGKSSTLRELLAVKYTLESFKDMLKHQVVLWHSDNMNTARIINVGSSKDNLQTVALEIFRISLANDIKIISKWVPRDENRLADSISKICDTDNWSIDDETFQHIQEKFGRFTIDRFSDEKNRRLERFDARFHCAGVENVNTFTSHWGGEFNWWCPPIAMVGEALKHAKLCRSKGVIFVPEWPSAYFWPLITPDGKNFCDFVLDYLVLDPYFINHSASSSVFSGFAKFRSIALLVDFNVKGS